MAQHAPTHVASSQKALMLEMKSLQEEPVEGFRITLVDEADLYNWEVAIFGPPNTHYEGGYFKVGSRWASIHLTVIVLAFISRYVYYMFEFVFAFPVSAQVPNWLSLFPTCFPVSYKDVAS